MSKAVISYDKELPEIPGRRPWEKPGSRLVKDPAEETGWRVEDGRRESSLLLVPKIRQAVDAWRDHEYQGASDVTLRLFDFWFNQDHEVDGYPVPFRYYYCQKEAIETLVWLIEIAGKRDTKKLIDSYATFYNADLFTKNIEYHTGIEGKRIIRRYVPELDKIGEQELPPENLLRYAFKMATGSGKTWVMAMAVVWSYFHKKQVKNSPLSTNFLIVAPNVIVYQRLEKDFASNTIFNTIPLVPREWGRFTPKVILRGESTEPDSSGNLFLTNIHQLYESRDQEWTPRNAVENLLGKKPSKDLASSGQRSMLERVKSLKDIVVINDEAHHVHEEDLKWSQSLLSIHRKLPKGLSLWLDFSATPKDQNGMYFPWTVCDYPLAQAVEDRIVKAPIMVTNAKDRKQPQGEPERVNRDNVAEKYGYWLRSAVERWKDHQKVYKKLGQKPVLFVVTEKNVFADSIGRYLWKTREFGFKESEVLVIHTDEKGEITKKTLEEARQYARDVDKADSKIKAIVSVMMLREGWDVRNVTVVLGLRPFTANAEILPEQVIGRGLRLMTGVGPERTQTLEVLGTRKLLGVLRNQLETEGVGVGSSDSDPVQPVTIYPVQERMAFDIAIPLTKPILEHNILKLTELQVESLDAVFEQEELAEPFRVKLRLEFAMTETEVHHAEFGAADLPDGRELVASITSKVVETAKLTNRFSELYPIVRDYVRDRCFGRSIDIDNETMRSHLSRLELQEGIAKYLARKISELTLEKRVLQFEKEDFCLSETKPFGWRRNLPPLVAKKTVFKYVATYNSFERRFAEFLDKAEDVSRFSSLGTTEQGESGTRFRVDYLKPSGAIGFYHPDWVVVQSIAGVETNWIVETKGRVWQGTEAKDEAISEWCDKISKATGQRWKFKRINQSEFEGRKYKRFEDCCK